MDNLYYYTFYLLTKFAYRVKKSDKDPAFTGVVLISTPTSMNLISIVFLCGGITYHEERSRVSMVAILLGLPILAINYFLLRHNRKNEEIVAYFDEKYKGKKHSFGLILLIVAYFVLSFLFGVHLAQRNRELLH